MKKKPPLIIGINVDDSSLNDNFKKTKTFNGVRIFTTEKTKLLGKRQTRFIIKTNFVIPKDLFGLLIHDGMLSLKRPFLLLSAPTQLESGKDLEVICLNLEKEDFTLEKGEPIGRVLFFKKRDVHFLIKNETEATGFETF